MQVLSDWVTVYSPGDALPAEDGTLKILLVGSFPVNGDPNYDWATKFEQGLASLTDPNNPNSFALFRNQRYAVLDPRMPVTNQDLAAENQEFVQSFSLINDWSNVCTGIFCNFLKKSEAVMPLYYFASFSGLQKLVVRCPDEYKWAGVVKTQCQRNNIPLLNSKTGNIMSVMQSFYSFIPGFQNTQRLQLPE